MAERSTAAEEKRRVILDAAARVFARKGFHTSRVGDIAEEAGVAHGLLYHYFASKDEVLETIFREHWSSLLERIHAVESSSGSVEERLRGIASVMFEGWRREPDVVRVVVREITRSSEVEERVGELVKPIGAIRRIIERGQEEGVFRRDLDADMSAIVFYGAIDELITGWVLGRLPGDDDAVAAAEHHIVAVVTSGLAAGGQRGKALRADVSA
ncbi:MAG: TetR/AcrR family transcriptional regulator [Actinobacteria bacterium]|nr:TetR/AcrR family transcriptional regulator [Actinomycetota bacterium]